MTRNSDIYNKIDNDKNFDIDNRIDNKIDTDNKIDDKIDNNKKLRH